MKRPRRRYLETNRTTLAFIRTLVEFCETALPEGVEKNGEWVIGDLAGNPGDSCGVNLATGAWNDFATGEGGGPRSLWATIFGLDLKKDRAKVLSGMREWVEKGVLPDGESIYEPPEQVARPRKKIRAPVPRPINSAVRRAEWEAVVKDNVNNLDSVVPFFVAYRDLSAQVFEFLIRNGHIGISTGPWISASKSRREFRNHRIVFPVCYGDDFYGMHTKWFDTLEGHWAYVPRNIPALPYVVGNSPLERAELVVISESSWDVLAYIDLYELYSWDPEKDGRWAVLATRGASNERNVPWNAINPNATIHLLEQIDDANIRFCRGLPKEIFERAIEIIPPDGGRGQYFKDLNEWVAKAGKAAVLKELEPELYAEED
jgi:hypothetical protein